MAETKVEDLKEEKRETAYPGKEETDVRGLEIEALKIVKSHAKWAAGAGLVPIPVVDLMALTTIQLNMLRKLAKLYGVPFHKNVGKSILGSLLGSLVPVSMAGSVCSLLKVVPIIGVTTSAISMSIVGSAGTYAVGKVFIVHFELGGTFLNFNPQKSKAYFAEKYREGRKMAS